jgi:23S rRNA (adenine2503-C2)-methyltransferase
MIDRPNLRDLSLDELAEFMAELGEKPFRARQAAKWLYQYGRTDFEDMTDLSKALRGRLADLARISLPRLAAMQRSEDGTRKLLFELDDGLRIESVIIPERDHLTLCVSSQAGCAMGCRFCRTASLGFKRNLTQAEIVGQFLTARETAGDQERLTNLVFMGMGEPLANRRNVVRALKILTEPGLTGISKRHISVSTVGLVPEIPKLGDEITIGLTVSLNAPNDRIRNRLMPVNRKYGMSELHKALAAFPLPRGRRITIAYVLLAGINDAPEHAAELSRYLHGLRVKINLIPFNAYPGAEFEGPGDEIVTRFQEILVAKNHTVIVRKSKGRDISAACGQLAGEHAGKKTRTTGGPRNVIPNTP